jgi:hypothetical protein
MPMRKTRVRERRPRIEPTSRPSDLVCLIFSRPNCDAALNLVQTYLPSFQDKIICPPYDDGKSHAECGCYIHMYARTRGKVAAACYFGVGPLASSTG